MQTPDRDVARDVARVALAIVHAQQLWRTRNVGVNRPALPLAAWTALVRRHRLQQRAQDGGFMLAERRLRKDLAVSAETLRRELQIGRDQWGAGDSSAVRQGDAGRVSAAAELYCDLVMLRQEFAEVCVQRAGRRVSVTTDRIELEGVFLGRFRIELGWAADSLRIFEFDVVPLEPNMAAGGDSYPHPHVEGTTLCTGEGRRPIENALQQLRLFDFFVLVRQILTTYNPGSAYVALEDWDSVECRDCGDQVRSSTARSCDDCCGTVCEDCVSVCSDCGERFCADCSYRCADCDEETCSTCLSPCRGCGEKFCRRCLTDDNCFKCDEKQEANEAGAAQEAHQSTDREQKVESSGASSGESTGAAADAAVHAVCVE